MSKTAGKGTTVSVDIASTATPVGAGLVQSIDPFKYNMATDDVTAIDSTVEERASSLGSWQPAQIVAFWDKSDAALGAMQSAREADAAKEYVITCADGSTQTADCLVTKFERQQAQRRGRLMVNIELTPVGDVTEADS